MMHVLVMPFSLANWTSLSTAFGKKRKLIPKKKEIQKRSFIPEFRSAKLNHPDENPSLTKADQMQRQVPGTRGLAEW